jgi:hypothetical protein
MLLPCYGKPKQSLRHSEENSRYSLKIIENKLIIVRKADRSVGEINVPYDSDLSHDYLPKKMMSSDGTLVMFPTFGCAYLMIDLKDFFENKCKIESCLSCYRIVGGGSREGGVGRTADYFRVERVLSDSIIEGYVNDKDERGAMWFIDLEKKSVVVRDQFTKEILTLREEAYTQYIERPFPIIVDADEFDRLVQMIKKL